MKALKGTIPKKIKTHFTNYFQHVKDPLGAKINPYTSNMVHLIALVQTLCIKPEVGNILQITNGLMIVLKIW